MKKIFLIALVFLLAFISISCEEDPVINTGSLTVSISDTDRGIKPNISLETNQYKAILEGQKGKYEWILSSETAVKNDIAVGDWTLTVQALNADNIVIGEGSTKVVIKPNEMAYAEVTITELEGEGQFTITLYGDISDGYKLKIYDSNKVECKAVDFSKIGDTLKADVSLKNGFYSFKIVSPENKEIKEGGFRIVKGDKISSKYEIQQKGQGSLTIINNIIETPSLELTISSSYPRVGESLTVVVTGMTGPYEWYLDGSKLEGESNNTVTLNSLDAVGDYEITCVSHNGSVVWSETKTFTVYEENYHPSTIKAKGNVEFYLASDVIVPKDLYRVGLYQDNSRIGNIRHYIDYFENETTFTCSLPDGFDDYTYYFESKYLKEYDRTLVYIVIDKEIENFGYFKVVNETNLDLDPYEGKYVGKFIERNGYIPILPYNEARTIKLECGTYNINNWGYTGSNMDFVWPEFDRNSIKIEEGVVTEATAITTCGTIELESSDFVVGEFYRVCLMRSNGFSDSYTYIKEDGKLTVDIDPNNYYYDKILVFRDRDPELYYETESQVNVGEKVNVQVNGNKLDFVDSGIDIPTGRIVVDYKPSVLVDEDLWLVRWKIMANGKCAKNGSLGLSHVYSFYCNTPGRLIYTDLSISGYKITVNSEKKSDNEGKYTLVTFNIDKDIEKTGTLIVNYDIPSNVELSINNNSAFSLGKNNTMVGYIPVNDIVAGSSLKLKLEEGRYTDWGWWGRIEDNSGNEYTPIFTPENFTIKEGEETTITVKLERYYDD